MQSQACPICACLHLGSCITEQTIFIWIPSPNTIPEHVSICGSWSDWKKYEPLTKQHRENQQVFFRIKMMLSVGQYQYKYIVQDQWTYDKDAPIVQDGHSSFNNIIQVFPKKMYVSVNKEGISKLTSSLTKEGLKITGSWDNWLTEKDMSVEYNKLTDSQESVIFINAEPDKEYEFKFKFKGDYFIQEKYMTKKNAFGSSNNIIITVPEDGSTFNSETMEGSPNNEILNTPNIDKIRRRSSIYKNSPIQLSCRTFQWIKVNKEFELPYEKVQGHTMCYIGEFIYIFGGLCRSEFYNCLTKIDENLNTAEKEEGYPDGRAFHHMVTYGNKIIIYGGNHKNILQDYFSYDACEQKWDEDPLIIGKYPIKKEKQSCVIYDHLLVFFGGYFLSENLAQETYYHEISVLDTAKMKWIDEILVTGHSPQGRFAHTASLIRSDMYIFGGTYNQTENLNLNDLWKINLSKVNELTWIEVKASGKAPAARHGHSMNALNNFLIIFGGQDNEKNYLNDLVLFDSNQQVWIYPIINGEIPRPRYYHASTIYKNDQILIFGGRTKNQQKNEHFYVLRPAKEGINLEEDN